MSLRTYTSIQKYDKKQLLGENSKATTSCILSANKFFKYSFSKNHKYFKCNNQSNSFIKQNFIANKVNVTLILPHILHFAIRQSERKNICVYITNENTSSSLVQLFISIANVKKVKFCCMRS